MISKSKLVLALAAIMIAPNLRAQHDMSHMGSGMQAPLAIPYSRFGSGTSWLPDSSPMRAAHRTLGGWLLMLHGAAFGQFDWQGTIRGDQQIGLVDWEMLMAIRDVGRGHLRVNAMTSLEPFAIGARGYPLILQTGESYRGRRLVNRQHPHDLVMELSSAYERSLTSGIGVGAYVAAVGEPALGPVAYMHRPSAAVDPFAPLGHHWQDASHVSFGVVTASLYTRAVKLEASAFNAREPDEFRFNLDYKDARLDSYAGRVTVLPSPSYSVSAWGGYLFDHDRLDRRHGMQRYGASILNTRRGVNGGAWSSALVWGLNLHHHSDRVHVHGATASMKPNHKSTSVLVESTMELGQSAIYGRAEQVQKSGDELGFLAADLTQLFTIRSLSAGLTREVKRFGDASLGVGARGSITLLPQTLEFTYGTRTPVGAAVFMRVRPRGR